MVHICPSFHGPNSTTGLHTVPKHVSVARYKRRQGKDVCTKGPINSRTAGFPDFAKHTPGVRCSIRLSPEQQQSTRSGRERSDSEGNISVNFLRSEEYLRIPSILCRKGIIVGGSPINKSGISAKSNPWRNHLTNGDSPS
jgi:hypothetical protein